LVIIFSRKGFFDVHQNCLIVCDRRTGAFASLTIWLAVVVLFRLRRCVKLGLNTIPVVIAHVRPSALNLSREITAIGPRMWKNATSWLMVFADVSGGSVIDALRYPANFIAQREGR
jgi:hypothetical protein